MCTSITKPGAAKIPEPMLTPTSSPTASRRPTCRSNVVLGEEGLNGLRSHEVEAPLVANGCFKHTVPPRPPEPTAFACASMATCPSPPRTHRVAVFSVVIKNQPCATCVRRPSFPPVTSWWQRPCAPACSNRAKHSNSERSNRGVHRGTSRLGPAHGLALRVGLFFSRSTVPS